MKRFVSFSLIALFLFSLFTSCEKPVVPVGGDVPVKDFSVPEGLQLKVGDAGTFQVMLSPEDATEDKILSLSSSDESVLRVSFEGLVLSYEAIGAGNAVVSIRIGSITKTFSVVVTGNGEDPVGPVVVSGVRVEVVPGLRSSEGLIEAGILKVGIESGPDEGNYIIEYTVDGRDSRRVTGVFVGQSRTFAMDETLGLGSHKVVVVVREEAGLVEPVTVEEVLWVKGPSLTDASVRFGSEYGLDAGLGPDSPVSLVNGENGKVVFRHDPATTVVVRDFDVPSFIDLDFNAGVSSDGLLEVPFVVNSVGEGEMVVKFLNGDEESEVRGRVDGKSARSLGVKDYSVPEDMKIALGGGSQTYTFRTVPEHAYNPEITELSSSDEGVLKVSWHDLTATFTPVYIGEVTVTVVLSGIKHTFPVKVVGNVVTDITVPDSMEIVMGESAEYTVGVTPMGALDASISSLSSSDESVLKVRHDGFTLYLQGIKPGDVTVKVVVGHIEKSFPVKVISDEVSDYQVPANMQLALDGGAQSYTFVTTPAHPSNGVITRMVSSDEGIVRVNYSGLTATFTPVYTGTASISMTLGGIEKVFPVTVTGNVVKDFSVPQGLEMVMGDELDYEFQVSPLGALDAQVNSLVSSDDNVLRLTYNGLKAHLVAGKMGTAKVTVKIGSVTKEFSVKVLGKYVTDFVVPGSDFSVDYGKTKSFLFRAVPDGAVDAELVEVRSSDETILKVEKGGGMSVNFTGIYPGTATVSVKIGSVTKSFLVPVKGSVVKDFTVPQDLSIERSKSAEFVIVPSPEDAGDKVINSLRCSDDSVVKVTKDGLKLKFEALKKGTATVTVVVGRIEKSFAVKVTPKLVTDFSVPSDFTLEMLTSKSYTVTATPSDADDISIVSLSSSNTNVLKVSHSGMTVNFEGVYEGTANVSVKVGTVQKTFPVKVLGRYVKDFSVPDGLTVPIGQKGSFTFVPMQSGCIDASIVSLSSSDESVIKTSYSGMTATFEAVYVGACTITAKVGSVTKTFTVTGTGTVATGVNIPADLPGRQFAYGERSEFTIVPTPSDAYDAGTLKVTSRNPGICTVESLGNYRYAFRGVGYGHAVFDVCVGRYSTTFAVDVPETVTLTSDAGSVVPWNGSLSLTVGGSNSGWSWVGEGDAFTFEYWSNGKKKALSTVIDGNTITIKNELFTNATDKKGRIVVTTPVTGAQASFDFTLAGPSGKSSFEATCYPDTDDHPVFNLTITNQSSEYVYFRSLYIYYYSESAHLIGITEYGANYYKDQLKGASPSTLYRPGSNDVIGRLAVLTPSDKDYRSTYHTVAPYSVYTESWTVTEYDEDIDPYDYGLGMTGLIIVSGMTGVTGSTLFDY